MSKCYNTAGRKNTSFTPIVISLRCEREAGGQMRKVTAMVMLVLAASIFSSPANADTKEELKDIRDQREMITEDLSDAQSQITTILIELETLNREIENIDAERVENQESVDETETKIDHTLDEISLLEEEMKELEKKMEERNEILKTRMSSIQKSGGAITYLEVIFGASSFSDFINRVSAVNKITNSDAALLEQQKEDSEEKAEKQILVFEKLDNLNSLQAEQEEMSAFIHQQLAQSEQQKAALENKQQEFEELKHELEIES